MLTKWAFSMMPNQVFSSLKTEEQAFQLTQNYTTILVVRHPFERIVSAYKNKLSNESDYDYYRDAVGKRIAREQASSYVHGLSINNVASMTSEKLKNLTNFQNLSRVQQKEVLEYSLVMKTGLISFQQFVKFLTKYATIMNLSDMDIHWRPQTDMCV
uniref:Carbohydrate sulfotransferase n=1 Tax=Ciona savignyi TaxID=51511 RepID=H2Z071_CIOSA